MIDLFEPRCHACQDLLPKWDQLARDVKASKEVHTRIAKCDLDSISNPIWFIDLIGFPANIPAILHIKDKEIRKYSGPLTAEDLYDYLLKKKWQDDPVIGKWTDPWEKCGRSLSMIIIIIINNNNK